MHFGGFPDSPVVKICTYNAQDTGLIPGQETKISHAVGQLNQHATTKTQHSQINKYFQKINEAKFKMRTFYPERILHLLE